MFKKNFILVLNFCLFSTSLLAYRIEGGDYYFGAGLGANVNVVRYDIITKETPSAQLPLNLSVDYAIDQNFGVFAMFSPQFSSGSVGLMFALGGKYWFSSFDAPYVPYISLAATPSFLFPTSVGSNHTNLGISPGLGVNFFVMANFLVGAHVNFNPSIAFVNDDTNFEFSVAGSLDVTFRI